MRQRNLWLALVVVVLASCAAFDALEVRRYNEDTVYYRSDWGESGHIRETFVWTVLIVGPLVAGALFYASLVLAARRRLGRLWRAVLYVLGVPAAAFFAFGIFIAVAAHPLLVYSDRTS